jgi:hypothetical protein
MFIRRHASILLITLLMLIVPASAQDTPPASVAASVGPFALLHPEDWTAFAGPNGTLMIAQRDPQAVGIDASTIAANAVVIQVRTFGLNRIPVDNPTAEQIMQALLLSQNQDGAELPEVTISAGERLQFARAEVSTPDQVGLILTGILNEVSFVIVIVTTRGDAQLPPNEPTVLAILDSLTLSFETGDYPALLARYAELEQGTTEQGFPLLGDPDAPVQFVEIGSFDCSACRLFHSDLLPLLLPRIAAGEISLTYVPVFGTGSLPDGDSAARAALCVADFWAYHDRLFDLHTEGGFAFLYERLQHEAAALEVDPVEFDACFVADATTAILQRANQFASQYMERLSTPTLLVNGQPVPFHIGAINLAIDSALAEANQE